MVRAAPDVVTALPRLARAGPVAPGPAATGYSGRVCPKSTGIDEIRPRAAAGGATGRPSITSSSASCAVSPHARRSSTPGGRRPAAPVFDHAGQHRLELFALPGNARGPDLLHPGEVDVPLIADRGRDVSIIDAFQQTERVLDLGLGVGSASASASRPAGTIGSPRRARSRWAQRARPGSSRAMQPSRRSRSSATNWHRARSESGNGAGTPPDPCGTPRSVAGPRAERPSRGRARGWRRARRSGPLEAAGTSTPYPSMAARPARPPRFVPPARGRTAPACRGPPPRVTAL